MASPLNNGPSAPRAVVLDPRVSQLRIALVSACLTICVFFFFFFASAAFRHDHATGHLSLPAWIWLLGVGFYFAPCILSWLLLSTREQTSIATGAGVACAFFGGFLLISPYVLMMMFLFVGMSAWNGPPDPGLMAAGLTLLVFLAISLSIVWSAFKIGKTHWNAFGVAIGATAFYLYFGFQSLNLTAFRGQQHAQQKKSAVRDGSLQASDARPAKSSCSHRLPSSQPHAPPYCRIPRIN